MVNECFYINISCVCKKKKQRIIYKLIRKNCDKSLFMKSSQALTRIHRPMFKP